MAGDNGYPRELDRRGCTFGQQVRDLLARAERRVEGVEEAMVGIVRIEEQVAGLVQNVDALRTHLVSVLAELKERDADQERRLRNVELGGTRLTEQVGTLTGEVKGLRTRGQVWDGLNSLATLGAWVLAWAQGGR